MNVPFTSEDVNTLFAAIGEREAEQVIDLAVGHILTQTAREIGLHLIPIRDNDPVPSLHYFIVQNGNLQLVTGEHSGGLLLDPAFDLTVEVIPNQATAVEEVAMGGQGQPVEVRRSRNDGRDWRHDRPTWKLSPYDARVINELLEDIYTVVNARGSMATQPKPLVVDNTYFLSRDAFPGDMRRMQLLQHMPVKVLYQGPIHPHSEYSRLVDTLINTGWTDLWVHSGSLLDKHEVRKLRESRQGQGQVFTKVSAPEFFKQFIRRGER